MTTVTTYRKVEVTRQLVQPCLDVTSYTDTAVSTVDTLKLPPQHRVKPNPLDLTSRGLQYTDAMTYTVERRAAPMRYLCSGKGWMSGYVDEHRYYLPGRPYFYTPTPNWTLALRNKIIDDKVSFAEAIGEWRESVGLVEQAAGTLQKATRQAQKLWRSRKSRRACRKWFKDLFKRDPANKFEVMDAVSVDLAIKFGIKPTLDLAYDSIQQLERYLLAERRLQVTVKTVDEKSYPGNYGGSYKIKVEKSYRAICYVRYDMDSREFTSGNLAESLWAGTRLSFMVDWWWNFGSYLSALSALGGTKSTRGVLCQRERVTGIDRRINSGAGFSNVVQGRWIKKSYQRTAFTSVPLPDLPSFRPPTTMLKERLVSAMEILATLRHKH